jgi:uncharacterized protein (TIGR03435 family)
MEMRRIESDFRSASAVTRLATPELIADSGAREFDDAIGIRRKLLLTAAGAAGIALLIVLALVKATPGVAQSHAQNASTIVPAYEVEFIRPSIPGNGRGGYPRGPSRIVALTDDGFTARGVSLQLLIRQAYGLRVARGTDDGLILGGPAWITTDNYDIDAKISRSGVDQLQKLSPERRAQARQRMLQVLLADRFELMVHREVRQLPIYVLVIAKNGPKLVRPKRVNAPPTEGKSAEDSVRIGENWSTIFQSSPISSLARLLSVQLGRAVVDKTGLKGNYDFSWQWTPDLSGASTSNGTVVNHEATEASYQNESIGGSISVALQEQLGLKLEAGKGPVQVIVIDHIEKPSGN